MYVNVWYACHTLHHFKDMCMPESHVLLNWNHFCKVLYLVGSFCWCWNLRGCLQALGLKSDDTFTAEMLTSALQEECMRLSSAPDAEFYSLGAGLSWCTKGVFICNQFINSIISMFVSSTNMRPIRPYYSCGCNLGGWPFYWWGTSKGNHTKGNPYRLKQNLWRSWKAYVLQVFVWSDKVIIMKPSCNEP